MAEEDENKRTKERCKRFTERVNLNIAEAGKLGQHMIKLSKSHEILSHTTKKFVNQENNIQSCEDNIRRISNIIDQMDSQYNEIEKRYSNLKWPLFANEETLQRMTKLNLISQINHQMHPPGPDMNDDIDL